MMEVGGTRSLAAPPRLHPLGDDRGSSLALVLMTIVLLSGLVLGLASHATMSRRVQDQDLDLDRAAYLARAGFERVCAELLLASDDWSLLPSEPFADEPFAGGVFDALVSPLHSDRATVQINARTGTTERALRFDVERRADSSGATIGIDVESLRDLTLAQLDQE